MSYTINVSPRMNSLYSLLPLHQATVKSIMSILFPSAESKSLRTPWLMLPRMVLPRHPKNH